MIKKREKSKKSKVWWFRTVAANLVIAVAVTCLAVVAAGEGTAAVGVSSNGAYYSGNRDGNEVALMINVYEGAEIVESMLEVLKAADAKATFFVGGVWADKNRETVKKIADSGCEIGNHGYFHKDSDKISEERLRSEITNANAVVENVTLVSPRLFAPPSGAVDKNVVKIAKSLGMTTVMWSKDTIDWRDKDAETVYKRATDKLAAGDLVLMHPKTHTLEALPKILGFIGKNGLKAVTVSQCIAERKL